jgi:hypothetical protein
MAEITTNGAAAAASTAPNRTPAAKRGKKQSTPPHPELEQAYGVVFSRDTIEGVIRNVLEGIVARYCNDVAPRVSYDLSAEAAMCERALARLLDDLGRRRLLKALWRRVDEVVKARLNPKAAGALIDEELLALVRRARVELFESRVMR